MGNKQSRMAKEEKKFQKNIKKTATKSKNIAWFVDNIATKFLPVYSLPDETGCKNFDFSYDSNVSSFILERNVKFMEGLSKGFNGKLVDYDLTDSVSERRQKRTKAEGVRYPVVALNLIKPNTYMNRSGKSTFSMLMMIAM